MILFFRSLRVIFLSFFLIVLSHFVLDGPFCPERLYRPAELFPEPSIWVANEKSFALPMFGRKYDMDCVACHVQGVFPRLNDVGFKFRRAGFRLPEEIGKKQDKKFAFGDYFGAAGQDAFVATLKKDTSTGESDNNAAFEAGEFTFWPLNGSLGKWFGTQGEFTVNTDGEIELENSNARVVYGNDHNYFTTRGGVFHALEGYGASDRPIGINYPLFMQSSANFNQSTLFTMVEPSLLGLEVGYTYKNTNISVAVSNSVRPKVQEDEVEPTHFFREGNSPADIQVTFNQLLDKKGSGVTAYYYTGGSRLPQDPDGFIEGTNDFLFSDRFQRVGFFGTYYPWERFALLTGFAWGWDHFFDPVPGATGGTFSSWGIFGEVNYFPISGLGLGARYDFFDPARGVQNDQQAASFFVNYTPIKWAQVIFDYQYLREQLEPAGILGTHTLLTRVMFLY